MGKTVYLLLRFGKIKPGKGVLCVKTGRGKHSNCQFMFADLLSDGTIQYCDIDGKIRIVDTPSKFALCAKRRVNPERTAENGWKCVLYEDENGNRRSLNDLYNDIKHLQPAPKKKQRKRKSRSTERRQKKKQRIKVTTPSTLSRPAQVPASSDEIRRSAPGKVKFAVKLSNAWFEQSNEDTAMHGDDSRFNNRMDKLRLEVVSHLKVLQNYLREKLSKGDSCSSNGFAENKSKEEILKWGIEAGCLPEGCTEPSDESTLFLFQNSIYFNESSWQAYQEDLKEQGRKKVSRTLCPKGD